MYRHLVCDDHDDDDGGGDDHDGDDNNNQQSQKPAQHDLDRTQASHNNARVQTGRQIAPSGNATKKNKVLQNVNQRPPPRTLPKTSNDERRTNSNSISELYQGEKVQHA